MNLFTSTFTVYYKGTLIKNNAKFVGIIKSGCRLTSEQVLHLYFDGDVQAMYNSKYPVGHFERPARVDRIVFDKCVVPFTSALTLIED